MPQCTVKLSIWMKGGIDGSLTVAEPQRQPVAAHRHRGKEVDGKGFQIDIAVEPILERGDDELAERLGPRARGRRRW